MRPPRPRLIEDFVVGKDTTRADVINEVRRGNADRLTVSLFPDASQFAAVAGLSDERAWRDATGLAAIFRANKVGDSEGSTVFDQISFGVPTRVETEGCCSFFGCCRPRMTQAVLDGHVRAILEAVFNGTVTDVLVPFVQKTAGEGMETVPAFSNTGGGSTAYVCQDAGTAWLMDGKEVTCEQAGRVFIEVLMEVLRGGMPTEGHASRPALQRHWFDLIQAVAGEKNIDLTTVRDPVVESIAPPLPPTSPAAVASPASAGVSKEEEEDEPLASAIDTQETGIDGALISTQTYDQLYPKAPCCKCSW